MPCTVPLFSPRGGTSWLPGRYARLVTRCASACRGCRESVARLRTAGRRGKGWSVVTLAPQAHPWCVREGVLRITTLRLAAYVELRLSPSLCPLAALRARPPRLVAPRPSGRHVIVATEYARWLPVAGAAYRGARGGSGTRACSRAVRQGVDCHDVGLAGGLLRRTRGRGGLAGFAGPSFEDDLTIPSATRTSSAPCPPLTEEGRSGAKVLRS